MTEQPHRIVFPLDTLLSAGQLERDIAVCSEGHLVVAKRTHWRPSHFENLTKIVCDWVEHGDA